MALQREIKELVRLVIFKSHLSNAFLKLRELRGQNVTHLRQKSLADRFSTIYANKIWLNNRESGSLSGLGSEMASTGPIRDQLPKLLGSLGTERLLDVGCGDFTWMKVVDLPCKYVGVDVVPSVIETNRASFLTDSREFQQLDATVDPLPQADTVLCREVLFHLSFEDTWRLLSNVRRSGAIYLIATNDPSHRINANIISGDFRIINLHQSPYSFPAPHDYIADNGIVSQRQLAVWKLADLPDAPLRQFAP